MTKLTNQKSRKLSFLSFLEVKVPTNVKSLTTRQRFDWNLSLLSGEGSCTSDWQPQETVYEWSTLHFHWALYMSFCNCEQSLIQIYWTSKLKNNLNNLIIYSSFSLNSTQLQRGLFGCQRNLTNMIYLNLEFQFISYNHHPLGTSLATVWNAVRLCMGGPSLFSPPNPKTSFYHNTLILHKMSH